MAVPVVLDDNTAYATKRNIMRPGTSTQSTAAETAAKARIEAAAPGLTITVAAGTVVTET